MPVLEAAAPALALVQKVFTVTLIRARQVSYVQQLHLEIRSATRSRHIYSTFGGRRIIIFTALILQQSIIVQASCYGTACWKIVGIQKAFVLSILLPVSNRA